MAYTAMQVANEFIKRGLDENIRVDPLKVQKLVYLAHGWHLAFLGKPLINETVEAWRYGPVVPVLYNEFRKYGLSAITSEAWVDVFATKKFDAHTAGLIEQVWKKYKKFNGVELSAITHEPGYAWDLARRGHETSWNSPPIPNEWIKDEFDRRKSK